MMQDFLEKRENAQPPKNEVTLSIRRTVEISKEGNFRT